MPDTQVGNPQSFHNMKINTIEGMFASASDNLFVPYLGLYALSFGATPLQIGMLNAFPTLFGNLLQIPYGMLAERIKDRKRLITIGALLNRCTLLIMAFIPFLVNPEWAVPVLIGLATFRVIAANLGVPAWTALQAEIIPKPLRGRYYANRNLLINSTAFISTLIAGRILMLNYPRNYQSLLSAAWLMGIVAILSFLRLRIKPQPRNEITKKPKTIWSVKAAMQAIAKNKNFAYYCLSSMVWNLGVSLGSPLLSVYFNQELYGSAQFWAFVQAAITGAGILCQRFWGRYVDKVGQKRVMLRSGIGVSLIPIWWVLAPHYLVGPLIGFWDGCSWGGYNLAAFNLLLEITPDHNRSKYVGIYNSLIGIASTIGPIFGGFLVDFIGLKWVLILSGLGRVCGLLLLRLFVNNVSEPEFAHAHQGSYQA